MLYGWIEGDWTFTTGDEVAAFDSAGTIRLHYYLSDPGQYGSSPFYGPPTGPGGSASSTFSWKYYSADEDRIIELRADNNQWPSYQGNRESYRVDLSGLPATPTPVPSPSPTGTPVPSISPPVPTPGLSPSPSSSPTPSPEPSPTPAILELVKTAGTAGPGEPYVTGLGVPVTFYYRVSNTGEVALEETEIFDDNGTPEEPGDDYLVGRIPAPFLPGTVFNFQTTLAIGAIHLNTARAVSSAAGVPVIASDTALALTAVSVAGSDYNGDGIDDPAVWNPRTGKWYLFIDPRELAEQFYFGREGDIPVAGDYFGDGTTAPAVFRSRTGLWAVRGGPRFYFGRDGDRPVPADYTGDGTVEAAIFRPSAGLWAVRGVTRVYFGGPGDLPIPGDYDGTGSSRVGIFRPSSSLWAVRGGSRVYFGLRGDYPVPADYRAAGHRQLAVFRPDSGLWAMREEGRYYFGRGGDWPQPTDYSGDGSDRISVYRRQSGLWAVKELTRLYWGGPNYISISR